MNYTIGVLKDDLIKILIEDNGGTRSKMLKRLGEKIRGRTTPVRPNRSPPRKNQDFIRKTRFPHNRKSNC